MEFNFRRCDHLWPHRLGSKSTPQLVGVAELPITALLQDPDMEKEVQVMLWDPADAADPAGGGDLAAAAGVVQLQVVFLSGPPVVFQDVGPVRAPPKAIPAAGERSRLAMVAPGVVRARPSAQNARRTTTTEHPHTWGEGGGFLEN